MASLDSQLFWFTIGMGFILGVGIGMSVGPFGRRHCPLFLVRNLQCVRVYLRRFSDTVTGGLVLMAIFLWVSPPTDFHILLVQYYVPLSVFAFTAAVVMDNQSLTTYRQQLNEIAHFIGTDASTQEALMFCYGDRKYRLEVLHGKRGEINGLIHTNRDHEQLLKDEEHLAQYV